jgi:hypothetical protein
MRRSTTLAHYFFGRYAPSTAQPERTSNVPQAIPEDTALKGDTRNRLHEIALRKVPAFQNRNKGAPEGYSNE